MSRHDMRNGTQKSIRPSTGPGRGAPAAAAATPPGAVGSRRTRRSNSCDAAAAPAAGGRGGGGGRGGPPNVVNAPPNAEAFRFYWNAPFEISPHNPAVVYMAGQYFFKSNNRGDTWWMNTTDLSKNINRWAPDMAIMGVPGDKPMASKHDGYAASSVATQVRESPSKPGVIWVGTEDGNLQLSQDGGETSPTCTATSRAHPKATRTSRASSLRTSTRAPLTSRSTITATTIGSPTFSRRRTTARSGSASWAISPPKATSTPCAKTTTIRTFSSSAPSSACTSPWTAARNGKSS